MHDMLQKGIYYKLLSVDMNAKIKCKASTHSNIQTCIYLISNKSQTKGTKIYPEIEKSQYAECLVNLKTKH